MEVIGAKTDNSYCYIKEFGEFIGADSIEYVDLGNGENYIIEKDGQVMEIHARGNKVDGGFLTFLKRN